MLVLYDNKNEEDNERDKSDRLCYENVEMLNLSYNPLITDQFMFKYCHKFKSLRVLEVSNTSISIVGISYFLKQQKNKWGLLECNYQLFDEYKDKSRLNPFEDYYDNSYDTYHNDKNYLKNPLPNMISKPVKPIEKGIEKLKFHHSEKKIHSSSKIINNDQNENENENENENPNHLSYDWEEEEDIEDNFEESLLYNSVFREEECYIEDRPSFNWHENRKIIKQNTLNYVWKLFRKIPLNTGVIRFDNNNIITIHQNNSNSNKRKLMEDNQESVVMFKKSKNIENNTSSLINSVIKDILH